MTEVDETLLACLKEMSLSDKEAKIYISALRLGEAPPSEIAQNANIKRPTAYVLLQGLRERGLVASRKLSRGEVFRASSPYGLLKTQQIACKQFEEALPGFLALNTGLNELPKFSTSVGEEAITSFWENCLLSKSEILYWSDSRLTYGTKTPPEWTSPKSNTASESKASYDSEYVTRRVQKGVWVRGIVPFYSDSTVLTNPSLRAFQEEYLHLRSKGASELREFRFVPAERFSLPYEITIVDDDVYFVTYADLVVARIQSAAIAASQRMIFKMTFDYARTLETELMKQHKDIFTCQAA